jgi:DNA repair protein RecN (Recombination protein N)
MGEIMKDMSTNMQILHNAFLQIAKGNVHFKVFKSTIGDDTQSELKVLTQKKVEIAQMLSGTVISGSLITLKPC